MEEGTWTLSKTYLMQIGKRDETSTFAERDIYSVLRNGYLYVRAYNKKGIYKININNSADVTLISFGFTTAWKQLAGSTNGEVYMILVNGIIMGWDFQIGPDDKVTKVSGATRLYYASSPMFQYKNLLLQWGGAYGSEYRTVYLLTPYLASINNLETPVIKTTEKTMKITYTLTQEA